MTARRMSARRAREIRDAAVLVKAPPAPMPRPDPGWWEETPAQAARLDRYWFDRDED